MTRQGFTLIEMMVAMVIGLAAVSSVYALGSAMSEQFFVEQRVASSQGASRVALLELRRDISRAGLFGSPNASLNTAMPGVRRVDPTCDPNPPGLPLLGGGEGPMAAFQYFPNVAEDLELLDPANNTGARADRLRILTSLYLTDQLLIDSTNAAGTVLTLQNGNQAFRRTFGWGMPAGVVDDPENYLVGDLDWGAAFAGAAGEWAGTAIRGARAFQVGSVLHIETPDGRHFFRTVFARAGNAQNEIQLDIRQAPLPVGTACLPGAAESSTVAPLQWVEYAIVNPFEAADDDTASGYMDIDQVFFFGGNNPFPDLANSGPDDLVESPNTILVRRILNADDGAVIANSTQIIAEFVTHFQVTFIVDLNSGNTALPANLVAETNPNVINQNPERVRTVIIDLGIRSPLEDPSLQFQNTNLDTVPVPTRFEVDPTAVGSARVRHLRIEVPVTSIARKNLG